MDDGLADFFGMLGNNLKTDGTASILCQPFRNRGRGEGIENAKNHRFDLISVNEVGSNRHHGVHDENQIKDTFFRMILMDNSCHKIGAAGVGAGLQQQSLAAAKDDTGHQRTQNGTGAAFRVVNELG